MKQEPYTVDYFIKKFKSIPANKFCEALHGENGSHCYIGHCARYTDDQSESEVLGVKLLFGVLNTGAGEIVHGNNPRYQQKSLKQRILAALYDIKKLQQGEVKETVQPEPTPVKVIHHYVSVPESIKASVPVWREN